MRNTIRLKMTYDEVRVMVFALNELRNSLIAENRYTDAVDDIPASVFCADCGSKMYNHRAKPHIKKTEKDTPALTITIVLPTSCQQKEHHQR